MIHDETRTAEFEQKMLACVHCGFCLTACPTYTRVGDEADSPRGRIYLMRAVQEGRLEADDTAVVTHIDRCLGCRACETVCPSGVEYGFLLERMRDRIRVEKGSSMMARMLLLGFGRKSIAQAVSFGARLMRATGLPMLLARVTPRRLGKLKFAMAMLAATNPARGLRRTRAGRANGVPARGKVAILTGCVQEGLYGRINRDTTYVLESNGYQVMPVADQVCCGALHAHSGELARAREVARRNIDAFLASGAEFIIINAAGCGAQMKQYGELLAHDETYHARAQEFVARVRDVSEFLASIDLRKGAALPMRVTYDAPCHLYHAQKITRAPLDVLQQIPELELVALPRADECCGGAGIYGLLHQDLGGRILRDKVDAVAATKASVVATPNPGCMMQIGAGLLIHDSAQSVVHPIELLAESYRRAQPN